jgi:hypothetical protein
MALVVAARCGVALVRKSGIFLVGLRLLRGDVTPHLFEVEILVAQKKRERAKEFYRNDRWDWELLKMHLFTYME